MEFANQTVSTLKIELNCLLLRLVLKFLSANCQSKRRPSLTYLEIEIEFPSDSPPLSPAILFKLLFRMFIQNFVTSYWIFFLIRPLTELRHCPVGTAD